MKPPACLRENVPVRDRTTFRIGGPARFYAEPASREELLAVLAYGRQLGCGIRLLGGGSNLLVSDAGVEELVVRLSAGGEFGKLEQREEDPLEWRAGAAVPLQALVAASVRAGAAGLGFLAGIPGTVGGAAAMNAGSAGGGIGQYIVRAEIAEADGTLHEVPAEELGFGYRVSALRGRTALSFILRLNGPEDPEALEREAREYRDRKRRTQPLSSFSAGCVFRNPPEAPAGMLLDQAGCKGMAEGAARVSEVHANFIVNAGGAASGDAAALAARMRRAVLERTGIRLETEIIFWGSGPEAAVFEGAGQ